MDALLNKVALAVTFVLQVLILRLLIKRQLRQRFFWFLAYIIYELIESALRLGTAGTKMYFSVYWWTEIGDVILSVMAVWESFLNVFREYARLRWFVWLVWSCVGVALLYSVFKAWFFPPVHASRQGAMIIGLEVALDYSLSAVGLLYFALTRFFKIKGYQWESGIISGFTIYYSLAVCGFLTRSIFGTRFGILSAWLPNVAYIVGETTWAIRLWRPERKVTQPTRDVTAEDLATLGRYIKILGRLLGRKP